MPDKSWSRPSSSKRKDPYNQWEEPKLREPAAMRSEEITCLKIKVSRTT